MLNAAQLIRRELLIRIVRAFDNGTLRAELDRIPVKLRPKNGASSRCCVYHDRAVIKYRLMALLGVSADDETDESKSLKEYFDDVTGDAESCAPDAGMVKPQLQPLTVCGPACSGCPAAAVVSTANCRGCFARPCTTACPKGAIEIVGGRSVIDQTKCIKCGKCINACPYHAIVKTTVPCEEACPVGAIRKNASGVAEIDFSRCISCGKCFNACPFGAVMERSQILGVLSAMVRGEELVAMIAPAVSAQFPGTVEQLMGAALKAGFTDVMEVALGAEVTTKKETAEFMERISRDPNTLMTTSCCPAYVNLVAKHLPQFVERVSSTQSPMVYAAEMVRDERPHAKTVFVGPCIAKRCEARRKGIDFVLSFEEFGAILAGRKIDVIGCEPLERRRAADASARNFAKSCGVTEAVLKAATAEIPGFKLEARQIDGIDRKTIGVLKRHDLGKLPGNFLEVMACLGGCVNGPCSLLK